MSHTLSPLTLTLGGQHLLMPIWPSDTWRPGQDDPPLTSNLIFCLQSVLHMGTQVFILSCATLIMALILFPELRELAPVVNESDWISTFPEKIRGLSGWGADTSSGRRAA